METRIELPDLTPLIGMAIAIGLVVYLVTWPIIAANEAPRGRGLVFFLIALCLGPLAPLGAALACCAQDLPRRRRMPHGYRAKYCCRCDARNQIPKANDGFACWRCGEEHSLTPV